MVTCDSVVETYRPEGTAPFLLVCEHASNRFPEGLGNLGIDDAVRQSHAAWDLGARDVACYLSNRLDAPLVASTVSRLLYDCNRPLEAPDCIPAKSEKYDIPGNLNLSEEARRRRFQHIHEPFHHRVAHLFETQRARAKAPVSLITLHSFTPVYNGERREVEIGFLHDADDGIAKAALAREKEKNRFRAALNEPYAASDGVTYTLRKHTKASDCGSLMIEIRNDLVNTAQKAEEMANHLADTLLIATKMSLTTTGPQTSSAE